MRHLEITDSDTLQSSSMMLFIPGLWDLLRHFPEHGRSLSPSLHRLLSRNDNTKLLDMDCEARLLGEIGWPVADTAEAPVAALERLALGLPHDGWWMRADPVSLAADRQYLLMTRAPTPQLDENECRRLAALINQHFAADGWQLDVVSPTRWYLKLPAAPRLTTTPTWRVVGRDVEAYMPAGDDAMQWHAWINELQMLLYASDVNDDRGTRGLPLVSSLWFWGAGQLPGSTAVKPVELIGSSDFLSGVAGWAGGQAWPLPDALNDLAESDNLSPCLILLERARQALLSGDPAQAQQVLLDLEQQIFAPLLVMLRKRRLRQAIISDTPGMEIRLSASASRKWWRRRQPLLQSTAGAG